MSARRPPPSEFYGRLSFRSQFPDPVPVPCVPFICTNLRCDDGTDEVPEWAEGWHIYTQWLFNNNKMFCVYLLFTFVNWIYWMSTGNGYCGALLFLPFARAYVIDDIRKHLEVWKCGGGFFSPVTGGGLNEMLLTSNERWNSLRGNLLRLKYGSNGISGAQSP